MPASDPDAAPVDWHKHELLRIRHAYGLAAEGIGRGVFARGEFELIQQGASTQRRAAAPARPRSPPASTPTTGSPSPHRRSP